jgi:Uma2 family endonuclease
MTCARPMFAFVSKARWDEVNDGYLPGAPELVVEIISPSNTTTQIREYAALCLLNGCQEFW